MTMKAALPTKSKRIKRVFANHDEVLHRWANQTQPDARCKNVFFEGASVWSYGLHYELGRLVKFRGVTVALINDVGYSVTTNKHIHSAYDAASHLVRFKTDDFGDVKGALVRRQGELIEEMYNHFNQRSFYGDGPSVWTNKTDLESRWSLTSQVNEFNRACDLLGFRDHKIELSKEYAQLFIEHVDLMKLRKTQSESIEFQLSLGTKKGRDRAAKLQSELAANEERRLQRIEYDKKMELQKIENAKKAVTDLANWKSGGTFTSLLYDVYPMEVRVNGDTVETTGRASVDLTDALQFVEALKSQTLKIEDKVGPFTVLALDYDADRIEVGCHLFKISHLVGAIVPKPQLSIVK